MSLVKPRIANKIPCIIVESPDGEQYTITRTIDYDDLRCQIIATKEAGWKVIKNELKPEHVGPLSIEDGRINGKNHPWEDDIKILASLLQIKDKVISLDYYLEHTKDIFPEELY